MTKAPIVLEVPRAVLERLSDALSPEYRFLDKKTVDAGRFNLVLKTLVGERQVILVDCECF